MRLEEFIANQTTKQSFKKGDVIFAGGSQAEAAYYIDSGTIEIFKDTTVIASIGAGQVFGEMALLRYDEHTLSARAASDVVLNVITPDVLHGELRNTPPLIRALVDMLIERIYHTNEALIDLDRLQ